MSATGAYHPQALCVLTSRVAVPWVVRESNPHRTKSCDPSSRPSHPSWPWLQPWPPVVCLRTRPSIFRALESTPPGSEAWEDRDSNPDHPGYNQAFYRLNYPPDTPRPFACQHPDSGVTVVPGPWQGSFRYSLTLSDFGPSTPVQHEGFNLDYVVCRGSNPACPKGRIP